MFAPSFSTMESIVKSSVKKAFDALPEDAHVLLGSARLRAGL